ncbi:MAG: hypothetical protein FJZ92_12900 [Chloroflexi bacterium]|nr:hypothetical protein [Chloroflexota bacterium]
MRVDRDATLPAVGVAACSTVLLGLGGWLWWVTSGLGDARAVFLKSVIIGSTFSLMLWLVWLLIVYVLMERLARTQVRVDELVRAAGFAAAPLGLGVLMVVPPISFGVGLVAVGAWLLFTQSAIERVSGISGGVPILANAAGFAAWAVGMALLSNGAHPLAPGPFVAEAIWDAITSLDVARAAVSGS